jgi:hypothetical protein
MIIGNFFHNKILIESRSKDKKELSGVTTCINFVGFFLKIINTKRNKIKEN